VVLVETKTDTVGLMTRLTVLYAVRKGILMKPKSMLERMQQAGVDVSWYEKVKNKLPAIDDNQPIPLSDEKCYALSIYLLNENGKLFTIQRDGSAYRQVRDTGKKLPRQIYVCVHCKKQFETVEESKKHY